jgi:hypothetical protein
VQRKTALITVSENHGTVVLRELLDRALRPLEGHEWRGEFFGTGGSARRLMFSIRAALVLDGIVEGSGRAREFPVSITEPRSFVVTGSCTGQSIGLQFWFDASFLHRTPFVCTGVVQGERRIAGDFSLDCFSGCGCGGGEGEFSLRRVDS